MSKQIIDTASETTERLPYFVRHIVITILFWGAIHTASLAWNISVIEKHAMDMGTERGRITFQLLETISRWNTWTGGIFARISERIQPNPFLDSTEEDTKHSRNLDFARITAPHMLRQISELAHEKSGITFHLSSQDPLNPTNHSDEWESHALTKIRKGAKEVIELNNNGTETQFKYIAPVKLSGECLQCHRENQVGDTHGGISIQIPAGSIFSSLVIQKKLLWFTHLLSFFVLSSLTLFFMVKLRKQWLLIVEAKMMQETLVKQRTAELSKSNEILKQEREVVETVINRIRSCPDFNPKGLRILATPVDKTNGDLILSASRPDGVHHLLVGDFTGHGLPAAVCGPLVSGMFYMLTQQGSTPENILNEINRHLCDRLPINMFLASSFIERNLKTQQTRIWNAGLPDVLIYKNGELHKKVESNTMMLGILKNIEMKNIAMSCSTIDDVRIISITDGIVETQSPDGELFGIERLQLFLKESFLNNGCLDEIIDILCTFREKKEQEDDITLVEARMSE